ncbi:BZ3500_MvSof-1268-A1-R1_Chr9g10804 [Microbotryum saponariae]|uniref:BZ3500_MvSof-1268-A1-R1_Chr9g10804 protein n=1 Tax=Microbotryum saponariae TaxID=289078 RepID=A0A2X0N1A1_9BASI|nr:BZ3501_MvSof-1269-A2-R1_Chr9g10552 [Microbotryum saponariae]SDA00722.1 BZ3500_MvSof-1268-A1-R1_Chr9g10804 [Microbotryum saponariae]
MTAKVVVITGCSRGGIGWALCEEWNRRGHRVFGASRSLVKMQGLSQGITPVELDVNSEASVKAGVAEIIRQAGKIDVCINNAGQGCVAPLIEVDPAELRKTFDVNVFGLLTMVQAVAPHMVEQRSGTIVNIGSIVAYVPTPWAGVYCATKAAAYSLSDTLRMELRGFGIKVVCVAPGAIKSAIGASNDKRAVLSPASVYSNVEAFVRSRGSWSQSKLIPKVAQAKQ